MKSISDFFAKFSAMRPTSRTVARAFADALRRKNISISEEEILYNRHTIYIKSNHMIKSEIFLLKDVVVKEVNEKLGATLIKDVR